VTTHFGLRRRHVNNGSFYIKGSLSEQDRGNLKVTELGGKVSEKFYRLVMDTEIVLERDNPPDFLDEEEEEDEECVKVRNLNKSLTPESPLCNCHPDDKSKPLINFNCVVH